MLSSADAQPFPTSSCCSDIKTAVALNHWSCIEYQIKRKVVSLQGSMAEFQQAATKLEEMSWAPDWDTNSERRKEPVDSFIKAMETCHFAALEYNDTLYTIFRKHGGTKGLLPDPERWECGREDNQEAEWHGMTMKDLKGKLNNVREMVQHDQTKLSQNWWRVEKEISEIKRLEFGNAFK